MVLGGPGCRKEVVIEAGWWHSRTPIWNDAVTHHASRLWWTCHWALEPGCNSEAVLCRLDTKQGCRQEVRLHLILLCNKWLEIYWLKMTVVLGSYIRNSGGLVSTPKGKPHLGKLEGWGWPSGWKQKLLGGIRPCMSRGDMGVGWDLSWPAKQNTHMGIMVWFLHMDLWGVSHRE